MYSVQCTQCTVYSKDELVNDERCLWIKVQRVQQQVDNSYNSSSSNNNNNNSCGFPALDDEADGGEADGHEVCDGEDDPGGHELGEGGRVGPVHRLLKLDRQTGRLVVCVKRSQRIFK